jgi:hypothetical protein
MNFANLRTNFFRPAAFTAAGLLVAVLNLRAADLPADTAGAASAAAAFSPPKEGEVLSPAMRDKMLMMVKSVLDRTNAAQFAHVRDAPNPFAVNIPPPSEASASASAGTAPAAPSSTPQLSSEDKLQQLADQLKPSGALIQGQNRLIIFANGDTLAVGQAIQVTFPGEPAIGIVLQEVSADGFTLKLGDTSKAFPFIAKESASRPNPPSTAPSQPTP